MGEMGLGELLVILLLVLVLFGPGRLPKAATGLGKAIRGFKDAMAGKDEAKQPAKLEDGVPEQGTGSAQPKG